MWEPRDFTLPYFCERKLNTKPINITSVPIFWISAGPIFIERILSNESNVRVDGYSHPVISRDLKSCSGVISPQHGLKPILFDVTLYFLDILLKVCHTIAFCAFSFTKLFNTLLHVIISLNELFNIFFLNRKAYLLAIAALFYSLLFKRNSRLVIKLTGPP